MKKNIKTFLSIIILCFISLGINAQNKDSKQDEEIFFVVEHNAEYPGGMNEMLNYLASNISYPDKARKDGIQGKVILTFVIETDGSLTDIKILRDIGGGCGEEAIRVVKKMPKWKPAKQKGKSVRQQFNLPVSFMMAK